MLSIDYKTHKGYWKPFAMKFDPYLSKLYVLQNFTFHVLLLKNVDINLEYLAAHNIIAPSLAKHM